MKARTLIFTLAIGLALPLIATAGLNSDPVASSFERDINRTTTQGLSDHGHSAETDLLHQLINVALRRNNTDPLLASFERDLHRSATQGVNKHVTSLTADPLDRLVKFALWNNAKTVQTIAKTAVSETKTVNN
jgi:hypothetical protein